MALELQELSIEVPLQVASTQKKSIINKAAKSVKMEIKIPMYINTTKIPKGEKICIRPIGE